jgi:hypothetical protein
MRAACPTTPLGCPPRRAPLATASADHFHVRHVEVFDKCAALPPFTPQSSWHLLPRIVFHGPPAPTMPRHRDHRCARPAASRLGS